MRYVTNTCPACGGTYEFLEQEIGREWTCPHCASPVILSPGLSLDEIRRAEKWDKVKTAFRWVAVLPASVGGVCVMLLLIALIRVAIPLDPDQFMWLIQLVSSAVCGAVFVAAGANTAPAHRFVTALVLTVIHTIGYTAFFVFVLCVHQEALSDPAWWVAVCSVAALAGSVWMCVVLHREEVQMAQTRPFDR